MSSDCGFGREVGVNETNNGSKQYDMDDKFLRPYDMNEMMEMTHTTQPLIGLTDRDTNGYKDRISGSSRYASTTSTLADEKL